MITAGAAAALGVLTATLVACGDADPREVAGDWATANAACGTEAVRRAYALEQRRGDEDPLDARLQDAREKPCRADGSKPEIKNTTIIDERGDRAVVEVEFLYFAGSATASARVVLVKSSDDWKVDTAKSKHV